MKSGGGVLCISVLQLVVGLGLLGIYEAYKVSETSTSFHSEVWSKLTNFAFYLTLFPSCVSVVCCSRQKEFFRIKIDKGAGDPATVLVTTSTPMDLVFFLSILNNIFAFFGLAGVINSQKELVTSFFAYNIVQIVLSFHLFVDVCVDTTIR